jgi:hypothetical protein
MAKRLSFTDCHLCKEVLFAGPSDPLDHYIAGPGGWDGVPLAVRLGSWRNLWRRTWYHQACCDVYVDRSDRSGRWLIFGGATKATEQQAASHVSSISRTNNCVTLTSSPCACSPTSPSRSWCGLGQPCSTSASACWRLPSRDKEKGRNVDGGDRRSSLRGSQVAAPAGAVARPSKDMAIDAGHPGAYDLGRPTPNIPLTAADAKEGRPMKLHHIPSAPPLTRLLRL